MNSYNEGLHSRALGAFAISISTSLALEGLVGVHEDHPTPPGKPLPYVGYDYLHVNVRTLIRNCFNAIDTDKAYTCKAQGLADVVAEEMRIISTVIAEQIGGMFNHGYYLPSYSNLPSKFPDAILRGANTPKQQYYAKLEDDTLALLQQHPIMDDVVKETTDLRTAIGRGKALMLTHYPVDILLAKHKRYHLLESHTGRIRSQELMNNKLKRCGLTQMPFDIMTVQFFGDTGDMFVAQPIKIRRTMETIAKKYSWNPITTQSRIEATIKMAGEPFLYDYVRRLYRAPKG